MANGTDIFDRLRQYEVQPPPGAFHDLMGRLQTEAALEKDGQWLGAFQDLQELEIQPPSFMPDTIALAVEESVLFTTLQDVSIEPPAGAFERILQEVGKSQTPGILRKLFTPFRAIAAVLVLVIAGLAIYYFKGQISVQPPPELAWQTNNGPKPVVDTMQQSAVATLPDTARYKIYDNAKAENFFKNNKFTAEGSGLQLVENDFIVTFASYQYEALPSFLAEEYDEESELLVRLDQYSYFTISENMLSSLRKMYQQRKRGTPTRRARKEREKLEQWKNADEARFDVKQVNNPLDPIDMAEFIFK
jgi:hypothetical protein